MSKKSLEQEFLDELIIEGQNAINLILILDSRVKRINRKTHKKSGSLKYLEKLKSLKYYIIKKYIKLRKKHMKSGCLNCANIKDLRVSTILDEFSFECFKEELSLFPVPKQGYKKAIRKTKPHILFVESAWHGSGGEWSVARDLEEIKDLVYFCRRKGIITVFWNKEDPVHFWNFIKKAQHFDFIFTTDEGMIEKYKEKIKNANVFPLLFAAQPKLHNPIKEFEERQKKAVFAGTFYRNKYPERYKDLVYMLSAAKKYGLDIYDRNYMLNNKFHEFPNMYNKNVVGHLNYKDINLAYKGYLLNLNINTVKESKTMFSRRVFEVLACNTPIISNYSLGIEKTFPNIVHIGNNFKEYNMHFDKLFNDREYYEKTAFLGVREVLSKHTYKNRVYTILQKIGFDFVEDNKKILIVSKIKNKSDFNKVINEFNNQTYTNKKLVIISDDIESSECLVLKYDELYKLETIVKQKEIDYIGLFNPCDLYGNNYISDLLLHEQYLDNVDGICKNSYFSMEDNILKLNNPNDEYVFIENSSYDRMILKKHKVHIIIAYLKNINDLENIKCYSVDNYNYIKNYSKLPKKELDKLLI